MAITLVCEDPSPADLLKRYSVPYIEGSYHLYIGTVRSTQGWILHLSVLPSQLITLLEVILPELLFSRTAFKVIRDKDLHYQLNAGHFGNTRIGKAVTVYAEEGPPAATLAARLITLTGSFQGPETTAPFRGPTPTALFQAPASTAPFRGPRVETDLELSPIVYARYGSFKSFRQADAQGYPDNYIYDGKGRLVRDHPTVPIYIPEGVIPPFPTWTRVQTRIPPYRPMGERYLPVRLMEDNYWGQTWKAIRLKGLSGYHCLLLRGKRHILSDEAGRDIRDRFRYRQRLAAALSPHIPLPEVYDCFEENGDTYLAIESPRGRSLDKVCAAQLEGRAWFTLPSPQKGKVLGYLAQAAKILGDLNQLGYVLPATETNHWEVTNRGKVYLNHLDTIYSPALGMQAPYFGEAQSFSGTFAQLCIRAITGLHPVWIKQQDPERLRGCLEALLHNPPLVDALLEDAENTRLIRVLSGDLTGTRPETRSAKQPEKQSGTQPGRPPVDPGGPHLKERLEDTLGRALATLSLPTLAANRKWFSLPPSAAGLPDSGPPLHGGHHSGWPHLGYHNGLYQGTSGILYFLREADKCGFAIQNTDPLVRRGLIYLSTQSLSTINHNAPGLFTGSAGFAIGLCSALRSGHIHKESSSQEAIRFCLERQATATDILTGAAGQGMSVLHCAPYLGDVFVRTKLLENALRLLETQQKDGSWLKDGTQRHFGYGARSRERGYGFGQGVAGICYFLLEYGNRYQHAPSVQSAIRGLNFLVQVSVKANGYQWTTSSAERKKGAGWFEGTPGIALTFLKAYECLGNPRYRRIAEETLRAIPACPVSPNLSLYNGLSGLGEIYLEAARILRDEEWRTRGAWIARLLTEMAIWDKSGSCYWQVLPPGRPTADLMVGNTGVMHFLLRYLHPDKVGLAVMAK
jgi:hypothetical protein